MITHSIGKVKSAYLITGSSDGGQGQGVPLSEMAKIYMDAYPTIDITKA